MDMEKLQTLLLQTAEVLEQFRRQSEQASQSHRQSAQQLQQLSAEAPAILRQAADGSFTALSGQIRREVGKGLDQAAEAVQQKCERPATRYPATRTNPSKWPCNCIGSAAACGLRPRAPSP